MDEEKYKGRILHLIVLDKVVELHFVSLKVFNVFKKFCEF